MGTYSHTSEEMIRRIVDCLQKRWENSLRKRAVMGDGRSPVPLLDGLLAPWRSQERYLRGADLRVYLAGPSPTDQLDAT
ncbi:hypothetical protein Pth03_32970 [Planotetraspora thailandica]|uniref:Uncharacterized protein n=1 Tax=Planotetraspora thailandica TaxID=487172 RepID=A0A8J3V157_9ACTN|nr:hypothetical protein Pth03_32970 [Planotetraspora thailandica]